MRGKVQLQPGQPAALGITPAYAGKSGEYMAGEDQYGDHPRVCGEKTRMTLILALQLGSPPRMRGKGWCFYVCCSFSGITPAYAGKSFASFHHCTTFWDHPRVCGEKIHALLCVPASYGLPPRVRGKGQAIPAHSLGEGITPAYAGKSSTATRAARSTGDHPRICGEKPDCRMPYSCARGSPPRVRGKDFFKRPGKEEPGITPAYAGKRLSLIV